MKRYLAYPLTTALVVCAVIGGLITGAYLLPGHAGKSNTRPKLEEDVLAINRSLQVYQLHGGKIPAGLTGELVLARLRSVATHSRIAGLKGSLIDPRTTIRLQTNAEAAQSSLRAYWDDTQKQFVLAQTGPTPGVKEFFPSDMPELSEDESYRPSAAHWPPLPR